MEEDKKFLKFIRNKFEKIAKNYQELTKAFFDKNQSVKELPFFVENFEEKPKEKYSGKDDSSPKKKKK